MVEVFLVMVLLMVGLTLAEDGSDAPAAERLQSTRQSLKTPQRNARPPRRARQRSPTGVI
ncbi:MAG: hypothetical protein RJP95_00110 [Pirellulales bacterium]